MQRKEINEQSPLRILSHGGFERHLGVVMARAGVGRTAFWCTSRWMILYVRDRVFHVARRAGGYVRSWYDAVFQDLARGDACEVAATQELIGRKPSSRPTLHGHGSGQNEFSVERLSRRSTCSASTPSSARMWSLIDSYDWSKATSEELNALVGLAQQLGVELWMTAARAPPPDRRCGAGQGPAAVRALPEEHQPGRVPARWTSTCRCGCLRITTTPWVKGDPHPAPRHDAPGRCAGRMRRPKICRRAATPCCPAGRSAPRRSSGGLR